MIKRLWGLVCGVLSTTYERVPGFLCLFYESEETAMTQSYAYHSYYCLIILSFKSSDLDYFLNQLLLVILNYFTGKIIIILIIIPNLLQKKISTLYLVCFLFNYLPKLQSPFMTHTTKATAGNISSKCTAIAQLGNSRK